jgi:two-component system sensor histidine kinase QseC
MKSIQSRLSLALAATLIALLIAAGALLYRSIRADLVHDFDQALLAQASALSSLVSLEREGKLDFEYNATAMPQYQRPENPQYFAIRFSDGRLMAASQSVGGKSPPLVLAGLTTQDLALPNGIAGRAARVEFVPHAETDVALPSMNDGGGAVAPWTPIPADPGRRPMSVVVAQDRAPLDASLHRLLRTLISSFALVAATVVGAVMVIVRASLRPLRTMGERVGQIDASQLHLRLPEQAIPAELAPIQSRLNDLLQRLEKAFARERRFTSDIAHELRTPIAELRSVTEVALRWPDDSEAATDALRESHAIARQMQTLVNTLLALVRSDRMPPAPLEPIPLLPAIETTLHGLRGSANADNVVLEITPEFSILAEPTLLDSVLRNVLANALEYGGGREVKCRAALRGDRCLLTVQNHAGPLAEQDIAHVFEPFWRKDSARSGTEHAGLGLALVRGYCDVMGAKVSACLIKSNIFSIEFEFPAAASSPPQQLVAESETSCSAHVEAV